MHGSSPVVQGEKFTYTLQVLPMPQFPCGHVWRVKKSRACSKECGGVVHMKESKSFNADKIVQASASRQVEAGAT